MDGVGVEDGDDREVDIPISYPLLKSKINE
jgi:hypothetical protein